MVDVRPPTVAVVTHNSSGVLSECLRSVRAECRHLVGWRLVVVDNNSQDDTIAVVRREAPSAEIIALEQNVGYAAAVNRAVTRGSVSESILVLNPDVRLLPGALAPLLEALRLPGTGVCVPRLVGEGGELELSLRREPTLLRALGEALLGGSRAGRFEPLGELVTDASRYDVPWSPAWASGAVMAISTACLGDVGPLDESFFLYSEETDFMLRCRDHGFRVRYVPSSTAIHLGGAAHTSPRLWALLTVNRVRLYARRHGRMKGALYRLVVAINEAMRSFRGPTHRAALKALVCSSRIRGRTEIGPPVAPGSGHPV